MKTAALVLGFAIALVSANVHAEPAQSCTEAALARIRPLTGTYRLVDREAARRSAKQAVEARLARMNPSMRAPMQRVLEDLSAPYDAIAIAFTGQPAPEFDLRFDRARRHGPPDALRVAGRETGRGGTYRIRCTEHGLEVLFSTGNVERIDRLRAHDDGVVLETTLTSRLLPQAIVVTSVYRVSSAEKARK